MKKIDLTQGKYALVDDEDFEELNKHKWHCNNGYPARKSSRKIGSQHIIYMHNVLMCPQAGYQVDHISGDMLDNQKHNLRICTHAENSKNTRIRKDNTSGYKGVVLDKNRNKWIAQIKHNGKLIKIGVFNNITDAAKEYDKKAKELFGEYARPNFS